MRGGVAQVSHVSLPDDAPINLINRARFGSSEPANVKAIMSQTDRAIDLGFEKTPKKADAPAGLKYLDWLRDLRSPNDGRQPDPDRGLQTPLLLLYPISRDSQPRSTRVRQPLNAVEHFVGLALVFPRTRRFTPQGYITADLSRLDAEREIVEHTPEGAEVST